MALVVQRCALEAAVTVNPAHKVVLYARTLSRDAFMAAELANNPAWQVRVLCMVGSTCLVQHTGLQSNPIGGLTMHVHCRF
jgi:hypothetical protein